jgi:hypothetical protein
MGVRGYELLEIAKAKGILVVMLTAIAPGPESLELSQKKGRSLLVPKEKISDIEIYLNDVLEAQEKGKSLWSRWLDRFGEYFDCKFGGHSKGKTLYIFLIDGQKNLSFSIIWANNI